MCARAGVGSRRIVLRWGARVVGGLWRRGEGAVVWCLLTPSVRAAARKRVLGRLRKVIERSNRGICNLGAREPSPNCSPPVSLAQKKLTEWFGRYRPATARFFWCLSTPSSRELHVASSTQNGTDTCCALRHLSLHIYRTRLASFGLSRADSVEVRYVPRAPSFCADRLPVRLTLSG